jgi:hypothetical protein
MPEICRFYGIVIAMYYNDHNPPHFHAIYGDYEANITIKDHQILSGSLPPRALGLVTEWASIYKDKLMKNWELARQGNKNLLKIKPII